MQEIRTGVWHWQASHPEWDEGEPWDENVSSYALTKDHQLVLIDPLTVPQKILELAKEKETAVVLSCPWHERDTKFLVEEMGCHVYSPIPDSAEDLVRKFGITPERAKGGSPDLRWLLEREEKSIFHAFGTGVRLPIGIDVFPGQWENDTVLWIETHKCLVSGDTLVDFGKGLELNPRWRKNRSVRNQIKKDLKKLLEFPIELVLATHGGPFEVSALEEILL